tara:strand:+ start:6079 stop:7266 length:1188 start_codon:yes stop_codon:yes gene_type:complete
MLNLENQDLTDKNVLMRVDLNVPLDDKGNVTDTSRIEACKATIDLIISKGGTCVLLSHLGRPIGRDNKLSLKTIVETVSNVLNYPVLFFNDCIGKDAQVCISKLKPRSIILMENVRFYEEETAGCSKFAKELAELGDIYVNDAFGSCHREHASTSVISSYFKNRKFAGLLLKKELKAIDQISNQGKKPVLAILGGAKVSSKLNIIQNLIKKVDKIIVGGGMAYTFIKALGGNIGNSLIEDDLIDSAKEIIKLTKEHGKKIILPIDTCASKDFKYNKQVKIFDSMKINDDWIGLDIGPKSIIKFNHEILSSNTIFWNGPVGVFEKDLFSLGTKGICQSLREAKKKGANVIVGGGDSIAALKKLGNKNWVNYISTGGGALLESLEGKVLPGVKALMT